MKNLRTISIVILALIFTVCGAFAQPGSPDGMKNKPGKQQFRKMKEIDEKYKNDPQYQQMKSELKTLRQEFMKDMKAFRDSGASADKEAFKARLDSHKSKMQAIETKYGSKYPDFFQAINEMRQKRMQRRKMAGPGFQNLQNAIKKYDKDPQFKEMMESIKKDRQAFRSEMQALKKSGATPDRETMKAKFDAHRKKMESYETRYGSKYPDFFKAVKEMRENVKNRRQHKGGKMF